MTRPDQAHAAHTVILHDGLLVGAGKHQCCYRHPESPDVCVKVGTPADRANIERELKYYRHLQRRGISWRMIAAYHGPVNTNLGAGHMFDLVTDFNGEVSRTLHWYLEHEDRTAAHIGGIGPAIQMFKAYMLEYAVVGKNFDAKNLLYKRLDPDTGLLVLVDDVGHKDLLPAATYIRSVARAKFRRRWRRFEERLLRRYCDNPVLRDYLQSCFLGNC